jgi:hypothetical protein
VSDKILELICAGDQATAIFTNQKNEKNINHKKFTNKNLDKELVNTFFIILKIY